MRKCAPRTIRAALPRLPVEDDLERFCGLGDEHVHQEALPIGAGGVTVAHVEDVGTHVEKEARYAVVEPLCRRRDVDGIKASVVRDEEQFLPVGAPHRLTTACARNLPSLARRGEWLDVHLVLSRLSRRIR